jgi:hypothetical protein
MVSERIEMQSARASPRESVGQMELFRGALEGRLGGETARII